MINGESYGRVAFNSLSFRIFTTLAFSARFLIQWLQSEKAQKSVVSRSFWQFSLIGNVLLMLHGFIQIQYPICLIQGCHAVISWRNLNLMQTRKPPLSFQTICFLLGDVPFLFL